MLPWKGNTNLILFSIMILLSLSLRTKQTEVMSKTNMFVFINELNVSSSSIEEHLNQAHDNFSCGSVSRGLFVPQAAVLASTNKLELHEG